MSFVAFLFAVFTTVRAQQIDAPQPRPATVTGVVEDADSEFIPNASISVDGPAPSDHQEVTGGDDASFSLPGLHPNVPYHLTVRKPGFADYISHEFTLMPGQLLDLGEIKMAVGAVVVSITAVPAEQLALEEVHEEVHQRVLGILPNFYVVYGQQFVPLSTKLKYELALRSSTDVVNFVAAGFVAGLNQAADYPNYVQGAKGYGQRFGAGYADATTDILFGGAVLPALLHQDPRYFYQGTGTKKSRLRHAFLAPFVAKNDNGSTSFNYSSIGGDFISASLSNIYYPPSNRGVGLLFHNAGLATGGRIVNAILQEFVLSRFTTKAKP